MADKLNSRKLSWFILATLVGLPHVHLFETSQANGMGSEQNATKHVFPANLTPILKAKDGHYARNSRNNPPPTEADAIQAGWMKMPEWSNAFHRRGPGNEGNKKYLPPRQGNVDRGMEAIYDKDGNLVTDPMNGGTYNYVAPAYPGDGALAVAIRGSGHLAVDVLPYLALGNAPACQRGW